MMIKIENNIVYFSETLTYHNINLIQKLINDIIINIEKYPNIIIINVSDLKLIDSTGIGFLILLRSKILDLNKNIIIKGLQGQPKKVFFYGNLKEIFEIVN